MVGNEDSGLTTILKTYKHLWEQFISEENFALACKKSQRHKKGQRLVRKFNKDPERNLAAVREMVLAGNFHTSEYKERKVFEPKERIIYKLPYSPDRIVQHAIMNILIPILTNLMIENTYACIEGRGQLKASQKCSEYVRKYRYCLKCDIHHFFPSVDQQVLSDMFHRIIKDDRFLTVIDDVVFSYPGGKNVPIGNFMSQWCGNFYLSPMDNFILHHLKPGGYERYCDDFLLFDNDKEKLHRCRRELAVFLRERLKLEFSKAEVFNTKQGVDFCGYRCFGKYVLIRKSTAKRIRRRMKRVQVKMKERKPDQHIEGQIASANGVMKHACSWNFRNAVHYKELWEQVIQREKKGEKAK